MAIFYQVANVFVGSGQYLRGRIANFGTYAIGTNAVYHRGDVIFIQAGIGTTITLNNAIVKGFYYCY
jgi:hypothetical protein